MEKAPINYSDILTVPLKEIEGLVVITQVFEDATATAQQRMLDYLLKKYRGKHHVRLVEGDVEQA